MSHPSDSVSHCHRLDKSLFAAGLQCAKRLYQEYHEPKSIPKPSETRQSLVAIGRQLTELAWEGFPRGVRVEEEDHAAAVERTARLLKQDDGAAIFDAAFARDGVEIRCDVVLPNRGKKSVDIFEVKSGTKVKPRHIMDVALQMWVIEGDGTEVRSASLLHLDAEYRHDGGKTYPVHKFFKNVDVTQKGRKRKRRIQEYIDSFQNILDDETTMDLPMGTWCITPIPCAYIARCRETAPAHPLLELPDLSSTQEASLHEAGIETIDQLGAATEGLSPTQRRVLRAIEAGGLAKDPIVAEEFETIVQPICFLWIGLALQVLPRYAKSRPWQHLPLQWSARILHEDGREEYRSFVADGSEDPRPKFVRSLVQCIDDVGTVVIWSRRLDSTLRQIMDDMPELKDDIRALLQMDPLALDQLVRDGAYHPAQHGSFEMDRVHHAFTGQDTLLSGVDEDAAQLIYEKMLNSRTRSATREKLASELAEYADARSKAMLEIFRALSA